jgi:hypothetical protein
MTRTTPAVLPALLGDTFEPVQVVAMVFAGVGLRRRRPWGSRKSPRGGWRTERR